MIQQNYLQRWRFTSVLRQKSSSTPSEDTSSSPEAWSWLMWVTIIDIVRILSEWYELWKFFFFDQGHDQRETFWLTGDKWKFLALHTFSRDFNQCVKEGKMVALPRTGLLRWERWKGFLKKGWKYLKRFNRGRTTSEGCPAISIWTTKTHVGKRKPAAIRILMWCLSIVISILKDEVYVSGCEL